jgi:hypothetical protein
MYRKNLVRILGSSLAAVQEEAGLVYMTRFDICTGRVCRYSCTRYTRPWPSVPECLGSSRAAVP